ncbi:MAG: hypothetical protein GY811_10175 [Myxococcales bacterium]|nr:hypothetical protein [Myxococcales bacterium]
MSTSPDRRWIVSRRFDLAILAAPLIASLGSLFALGVEGRSIPLWAFLLIIVCADVAHVWATTYITYLDSEVFRRRRLLLLLPIPLSFLISYRLHDHSPELFWTLLAYVAIYHFIQQQWGFIALYKARGREKSSFDYYLDKWTLWAGSLGPVLLWHASPARQFDWFNAGESFIVTIPENLRLDIVLVSAFFGLVWVLRQVQRFSSERDLNVGKTLWMVFSWISWWVGISLADHPLISAAFLNLFHGVPFIALVWHRSNRKWQGQEGGPSRLVAWLSQRRNWVYFMVCIIAAAAIEESLWDGMVWRVYLPSLLGLEAHSSASLLSFWVALLSVPQIVHYYLDAWIWKLDTNNPDLPGLLKLGGGAR